MDVSAAEVTGAIGTAGPTLGRGRGWRTMSPGDDGITWSDIAGWYDNLLEGGSGPHELATATTLELVPPLAGLAVVDVGCGTGMATRALADAGAAGILGVDLTPEQIEIAQRHEQVEPRGIGYRVDDAQTLVTVDDASIDLVTCQLALMDIPDLDATLGAIHRVVRPGGHLVFVIGHPVFLAPHAETVALDGGRRGRLVVEYLDDRFWRSANPNGVRRVGNFHRTLSTYLNALAVSGFVVERTAEPPGSGLLAAQQPEYRQLPIFFAARVRRL